MVAAVDVYIPSDSVKASMQVHLSRRDQWVPVRKDGRRIFVMPSSDGKRVYGVGQRGESCTCEGARRYPICAHQWAVREAMTQDALSEYLADAADELLAEYDRQQRSSMTAWKTCRCGAMIEPEARSQRQCSGCIERGLMLLFAHVED